MLDVPGGVGINRNFSRDIWISQAEEKNMLDYTSYCIYVPIDFNYACL